MQHAFHPNVSQAPVRGVRSLQLRCIAAERSCRAAAQCSQSHGNKTLGNSEENAVAGVRAVAFVAVMSLCLAPREAQAWQRDWSPRRHHKRMAQHRQRPSNQQSHEPFGGRQSAQSGRQQTQQQGSGVFAEMGTLAHDVQHSLHKMVNRKSHQSDPNQMHMRMSAPQQQSTYPTRVGIQPPAPARAPVRYGSSGRGSGGPGGLILLIIAAGALLWLVLKGDFSGVLASIGQGNKAGGKWVRDRSLGGKMVWVSDDPKDTKTRSRSPSWDDIPSSSTAVLASDEVPDAVPTSSGRPAAAAVQQEQKGPPSWWDPPPTIHVDKRYKDQASNEARAILRQMEDGKLLSGRDYAVSALVSLRQTCADTGAAVKAQTASGGDAIFRAGVEAAVSAAMESGEANLGGTPPQRFVSGLAKDLGLPDDKAAVMAVAVVSARLRSVLVDAAASYRSGDEFEVLTQLVRIVGVLDKMPLPAGSPQADMIATAVQQRATLEERQALFFTYGGMEPSTAPLVAEMLGFNPELVMPQLQKELQSVQQTSTAPTS